MKLIQPLQEKDENNPASVLITPVTKIDSASRNVCYERFILSNLSLYQQPEYLG